MNCMCFANELWWVSNVEAECPIVILIHASQTITGTFTAIQVLHLGLLIRDAAGIFCRSIVYTVIEFCGLVQRQSHMSQY